MKHAKKFHLHIVIRLVHISCCIRKFPVTFYCFLHAEFNIKWLVSNCTAQENCCGNWQLATGNKQVIWFILTLKRDKYRCVIKSKHLNDQVVTLFPLQDFQGFKESMWICLKRGMLCGHCRGFMISGIITFNTASNISLLHCYSY